MEEDRKYDIAISFAGEDRKFAEELAVSLKNEGINVFYDSFEQSDLWGKNLYSHLSDVYRNQAKYCVMLLSQHYVKKAWTKLEREAGQSQDLFQDSEYILPIRLDDSSIKEILPSIGYLSWTEMGISPIIKSIKYKLDNYKGCKTSSTDENKNKDNPATSEGQKFALEARDGTVFFGEDKYKKNGSFKVQCRFYILVGDEHIRLLNLKGLYYAYGCPALSISPEKLFVNSEEIPLTLEGDLSKQVELHKGSRANIEYIHRYCPPLMNSPSADCDDGDISINISWRTKSILKTRKTNCFFSFVNSGIRDMVIADFLRKPPRVTDDELKEWNDAGKITDEELLEMLEINPISRYMEAFSDNNTTWRHTTGYKYSKILRKLVGNNVEPYLS